MAKNLLIVESPAKTRTLARFLGADFEILSTIGHIRDLPKSKLGVDPDNNFEVEYTTIKGKEKVIAELRKASKKADTIYLAPDPDREGEAIAWHVQESLNNAKGIKAKIVRVTFNEITKSAVTEAIKNPREINMNLVNAQQARRVLDRVVGYKVSPFLWKTVARNLSAGRVQSVALRLICEREVLVKAFNPQEYWQVAAQLETDKKNTFEARLIKIDDKTISKPDDKGAKKTYIKNEKEVKAHIKELKNAKYQVTEIKETSKTKKPMAPFITSTLQQEAAKKFGFTAKVTMGIAQKLYEGIEITKKDGPVGLITYMRTDSTRISNEAIGSVRNYIEKNYGSEYLPNKPIQYGKKKAAQDAHEAIRPTYTEFSPEKVKKKLTPQQFKIYSLIWNRFVASQMNPAKLKVLSVDIEAGKYLFRVSSQKIVFDGFLRIYNVETEEDENNNENGYENIPNLNEKDILKLLELTPRQSFTKPPARYSEAMLVKELESEGIGRPSTYASIISTLKDRQYVDLIERRLHPTDLGVTVSKILVENFPNLFNVKFTAEMEKDLDLVEEGIDDWKQVLNEFYTPLMKTLDDLKGREKEIKSSMEEKTDIKCEKCGSPMIIKWGRNGRFLACSAYPECKSTKPLPEDEEKSKTDAKCEKCGSPMVIKTGRFGRFMACSAYPDCKSTKPITLGIKCPKEGCTGDLLEKKTKTKRPFYGCTKYPKCDFASWAMPVKEKCPACKNPFMVAKNTKSKGEFYQCPECKHELVPESKE